MSNIFGIVFMLIGLWQMYATVKYFKTLKVNAGKSTSAFSPMAIYFSFALSLIFFFLGLAAVFNLL